MNRCVREGENARTAKRAAEKARDKVKREKELALELCNKLRGYRKQYQDMAVQYPKMKEQRDKAVGQVEELTERAEAAEDQADKDRAQALQDVKAAEKARDEAVKAAEKARDEAVKAAEKARGKAVKARDKANAEKELALKVCDDLRGYRKQYQDMATQYPKMKEQCGKAVGQVEELTERAEAAEEQADKDRAQALQDVQAAEKARDKAVKARDKANAEKELALKVLNKLKELQDQITLNSRKHPWLAVATALNMSEADTKKITRAAKSMHDTKSLDWKDSLSKRSQLVVRLPSIVRLLLKCLFSYVRVNQTPVPVEEIINLTFREDIQHDDIALQEIRKAVQSAVRC